jgi:hypothetical protein
MAHEPPNQFGFIQTYCTRGYSIDAELRHAYRAAMTSVRCRELAVRSSNGTQVRLLWRQGTRQLWVEVREPHDRLLAIPVRPERALDAFYHPYAYAGSHSFLLPVQSLTPRERRPQAADSDYREQ